MKEIKSLDSFVKFFKEFLKRNKKNVLVTFHSNGDVDACVSAEVLAEAFGFKVLAPDRINSRASRILRVFGEDIQSWNGDAINSPVVLLDTNSYSMLPEPFAAQVKSQEHIFIDHHQRREEELEGVSFVSQEHTSSSGIVLDLLIRLGKPITKKMASLLLFGIIEDSANFKNSNSKTFEAISFLTKKSGLSYMDAYSLLYSEERGKEVFEELRKVKYKYVVKQSSENKKEYKRGILAYGIVKESFEVPVADLLVDMGITVAVIGSWSRKYRKNKISLRAGNEKFINLAVLANRVGSTLGGSGGGHRNAAGIFWKGSKKELPETIDFVVKGVEYDLKF